MGNTLRVFVQTRKLGKLDEQTAKAVSLFSLEEYTTKAVIPAEELYDGDTCKAIFYHQNKLVKFTVRMIGYDSPEMKPRLDKVNREAEKAAAIVAKNRLKQLIANPHQVIILQCGKWDKYGRLLGTIYLTTTHHKNGTSINQQMIDEGHGKAYDGGKKDDF
jgi:endonuclease YncB( thermonuclease family)